MYSVEADRLKRLLVISAAGEVTKKEVENAALQIREIMKEITPGFRVLADFRWLDRMEPAAAAGSERCRGSGAGGSRSTQRHWLKYSFAISLRPANQTRYLRVVSGSVIRVNGRNGVRWLRRASPYQSWSRVQTGMEA